MKAETIPIGERIVAEQAALDRLFGDRSVTATSMETATGRIAADQGALRAAHLRYHLEKCRSSHPPKLAAMRSCADIRPRTGMTDLAGYLLPLKSIRRRFWTVMRELLAGL